MANGKIYIDQSNLKITAETGVTVTGATETFIKFFKPDGTAGQFDATIVGTQDIEFDFSEPSELDQAGVWIFWAKITFAGGRKAPGEPERVQVFIEGT